LRRVRFDARLRLLGVRVASLRREAESLDAEGRTDTSRDLFDQATG